MKPYKRAKDSTPNGILRGLENIGDYIIIETTEEKITSLRAGLFQYDRQPEELKNIRVSCTKMVGVVVSHEEVGKTVILLKITRIV